MRRFPFTLALLPGGELAGAIDVRARAAGGFVIRLDARGVRGHVSEITIWTAEQIREATGTDLDAHDEGAST